MPMYNYVLLHRDSSATLILDADDDEYMRNVLSGMGLDPDRWRIN